MTTLTPLISSTLVAPKFTANLDGDDYSVVITWNMSGQRYYINVYDTSGNWITTVPIISSPPGEEIASAAYDPNRAVMTMTKRVPGGHRKPGTIVEYTLQGFMPQIYNGVYQCLTINDTTFSYPLAVDPGQAVILGSAHRLLNMVAGLFQSTMVYRNGCFEVSP